MQEGLRPGGVRGAFIQGAVRGASPTAVSSTMDFVFDTGEAASQIFFARKGNISKRFSAPQRLSLYHSSSGIIKFSKAFVKYLYGIRILVFILLSYQAQLLKKRFGLRKDKEQRIYTVKVPTFSVFILLSYRAQLLKKRFGLRNGKEQRIYTVKVPTFSKSSIWRYVYSGFHPFWPFWQPRKSIFGRGT